MVNSKQKGNSWENHIAKVLRGKFIPPEVDAKLAHNLIHRTPMSGGHVEKGDLIIKPPIWKQFPWFIECRNRQVWNWKQIMEQGQGSVIGTWFWEDAVEKCHPYDENGAYPRRPLLLFTKNYESVYFMAYASDIEEVLNVGFSDLPNVFGSYMIVDVSNSPVVEESIAVIGDFNIFLTLHNSPMDEIREDIRNYIGAHNA